MSNNKKSKYKIDYKTDDENWFEPCADLRLKSDLEVQFLKIHPDARLPEQANEHDAGWDIFSTESVSWKLECPMPVPTGLKMVLPPGWEAQVRPRSGLSLKGWTVCNSPGTIDAGYRGEIMVIMKPDRLTTLDKGTKIAQLVFKKVPQVSIREISKEEFEKKTNTTRGVAGFGSTGNK